jgi:putative SOS response-associated peptidase YedK
MFRNAIRRRRCLIPADGFYEWQAGPQRKQPHHVGMVDAALFAFAGIWEYRARDGQTPRVTCAIIVTHANELMAPIHDRMPVIIAPEDYARWLDPAGTDQAGIARMLLPYAAELMRAYPVSSRVNDARNDDAQLVKQASDGTLP